MTAIARHGDIYVIQALFTIIAICIAIKGVLFSIVNILLLVFKGPHQTAYTSPSATTISKNQSVISFLYHSLFVFYDSHSLPIPLHVNFWNLMFFCKFEAASFKTQIEIFKGTHGFLLSGQCTIVNITIQLLNWSSDNHHDQKTIHHYRAPLEYCQRVIEGIRAPGVCFFLIALMNLETTAFWA